MFETDPPARFALLGFDAVAYENFPLNAPALISAAQSRHSGEWNEELKLAYQLVHASLSDSRNHEARFILPVTAIEALIPYRERIPAIVRVLQALISQVRNISEVDDETRDAVLRCLTLTSSSLFGRLASS